MRSLSSLVLAGVLMGFWLFAISVGSFRGCRCEAAADVPEARPAAPAMSYVGYDTRMGRLMWVPDLSDGGYWLRRYYDGYEWDVGYISPGWDGAAWWHGYGCGNEECPAPKPPVWPSTKLIRRQPANQ